MADLDISLLHRLLNTNPLESEESPAISEVIAIADGDGVANEEDRFLSEAEAQGYLERSRTEIGNFRGFLGRNRTQLVGSLADAQQRLRDEEGLAAYEVWLETAASQDDRKTELSAQEIALLEQELGSQAQAFAEFTPEAILHDAETLVNNVREVAERIPEVLVPEDEAAQRAPIDLNYLKRLPETALSEDVIGQLRRCGIDPADREQDWTVTLEHAEAVVAGFDDQYGDLRPELVLSFWRANWAVYRASAMPEIGTRVSGVPLLTAHEPIDLIVLIERQSYFTDFPQVRELIAAAGPDVRLSDEDLHRYFEARERQQPGFLSRMLSRVFPWLPNDAGFTYGYGNFEDENVSDMDRALAVGRALAADLVSRANALAPSPSSLPADMNFDPNWRRSHLVVADLERMRAGFTHRDRQYVEHNALVQTIDFASYLGTLGGGITWFFSGSPRTLSSEHIEEFGDDTLPRFGPTYIHYLRESVAEHDAERTAALAALRALVEQPPADFSAERTIPNFLEYLENHEAAAHPGRNARYAELLRGDLFQAEHLWNLRGESDPDQAAEAWFTFAQELRDGVGLGPRDDAHTDIISNLDYSRAILHALLREPDDPAIRRRVRTIYQDSIGLNITDDDGNIVEEGGGELGIFPWDWFRNWSDEEVENAVSEGILFAASCLVGSGMVVGGWRVGTMVYRGVTNPVSRRLAIGMTTAGAALVGLSFAGQIENAGPRYEPMNHDRSYSLALPENSAPSDGRPYSELAPFLIALTDLLPAADAAE